LPTDDVTARSFNKVSARIFGMSMVGWVALDLIPGWFAGKKVNPMSDSFLPDIGPGIVEPDVYQAVFGRRV
jgi:hypothetical protein